MAAHIECIEILTVEAKLTEPFGWSQRWTDVRGNTVVKLVTSDGVAGWGEGAPGAAGRAIAEALAPLVLGQNPLDHGAVWT
jgi:L-alanine-DL-glutamate epimerase-like enolase superfamily enzyme